MTVSDRDLAPAAARARTWSPRRVLAFFAFAYAISWAWVIPWAWTGHTVRQGSGWPTHLPSLLGPLLSAVVLTAWSSGGSGVRELLSRMVRWRIGWRWWLAATSPLLFFFVVLAVMRLVGATVPSRGEFAIFSGVPSAWGILGVWAVVLVVNGYGEETGWRGYALPQLQLRFGPLTATVILAAAWAAWHLPQFFLLQSYQDFSLAMLPIFVFGLFCGAVVLTWLYNHTGGSILAAVVWHGLYNLTGATKAAGDGSGALAAVMWTFVVVQALVLLALEWRAHSHGKPSPMRG